MCAGASLPPARRRSEPDRPRTWRLVSSRSVASPTCLASYREPVSPHGASWTNPTPEWAYQLVLRLLTAYRLPDVVDRAALHIVSCLAQHLADRRVGLHVQHHLLRCRLQQLRQGGSEDQLGYPWTDQVHP